jgi:hypothetical protein
MVVESGYPAAARSGWELAHKTLAGHFGFGSGLESSHVMRKSPFNRFQQENWDVCCICWDFSATGRPPTEVFAGQKIESNGCGSLHAA